MLRIILLTIVVLIGLQSAELKSVGECVVGKRVLNRKNEAGKITGVSNGMCKVQLDGGTETTSMHWMLRPESDGARTTSDKLVSGIYKCYSLAGTTLNYMFMDVKITGPDSYEDKNGAKGKYKTQGSKIVLGTVCLPAVNMDGVSTGFGIDKIDLFGGTRTAAGAHERVPTENVQVEVVVPIGEVVEQRKTGVG